MTTLPPATADATAQDLSRFDPQVLLDAADLSVLRLTLSGQDLLHPALLGPRAQSPRRGDAFSAAAAALIASWMRGALAGQQLQLLASGACTLTRVDQLYEPHHRHRIIRLTAGQLSAKDRNSWYELLQGDQHFVWRTELDREREIGRSAQFLAQTLERSLEQARGGHTPEGWSDHESERHKTNLEAWHALALQQLPPQRLPEVQRMELTQIGRWAAGYHAAKGHILSWNNLRALKLSTWAELHKVLERIFSAYA